MIGRAWCPDCGRYVETTKPGAVEIMPVHDLRRGIQCRTSGVPWPRIVAELQCDVPMTVAE